MTDDARALYRALPRMNDILEDHAVQAWAEASNVDRELVRRAAEGLLEELRGGIAAGELDSRELEDRLRDLAGAVEARVETALAPHLRRVVNASGVIVHTNLGRAPWSEAAARRVAELAGGYLNLEIDLEVGRRGGRDEAVARLVARLLPGAAVAVVNNNAAAVLLVLNTLGEGREVVVSRGQLVEIGGSFRIPDVMAKGFCRLREVGTTNRTRIDDFRAAIGPDTGLLLAVHPSNYRMVGFTESVPLEELVALGRESGVPVVEDLGSGTLVDLSPYGIPDEPTVGQRLEAGVDLVTFSGDKLLGGPQAGFIVGSPELVQRVKKNSLYRALRLDKAALLALEATLTDYAAGRRAQVPVLAMLAARPEELRARAHALAELLGTTVSEAGGAVSVVETESRVGGGAAPEVPLPSFAVALDVPCGADDLAARLRRGDPPVLGRIDDDRLLLDVRTLLPGDDRRIAEVLAAALTLPVRGC